MIVAVAPAVATRRAQNSRESIEIMAKSLQEQLLSAGLVKPKQATQIKQEKRKDARQQPKKQAPEPTPAQRAAEAARAQKTARDRELNRQRQMEAERRAIAAQVDQLIEGHRIETTGGEIGHQFVVRGKIKKMYVTAEQHAALVSGTLAVVRYRQGFALVDKATAERVAERDLRSVALLHEGTAPAAEAAAADETYADYQVPDDLMW